MRACGVFFAFARLLLQSMDAQAAIFQITVLLFMLPYGLGYAVRVSSVVFVVGVDNARSVVSLLLLLLRRSNAHGQRGRVRAGRESSWRWLAGSCPSGRPHGAAVHAYRK